MQFRSLEKVFVGVFHQLISIYLVFSFKDLINERWTFEFIIYLHMRWFCKRYSRIEGPKFWALGILSVFQKPWLYFFWLNSIIMAIHRFSYTFLLAIPAKKSIAYFQKYSQKMEVITKKKLLGWGPTFFVLENSSYLNI